MLCYRKKIGCLSHGCKPPTYGADDSNIPIYFQLMFQGAPITRAYPIAIEQDSDL
jgi:hypothetical protein